MSGRLDLLIVPLHRQDGQDQARLPGLHLASAPRRAARGRKGESLVVLLSLQGSLRLRPDQLQALLDDMAAGYFQAQGSVTAALREQAERLNYYLLKQNQEGAGEQRPSLALLSMLALRGERAILGQCGPVHAFLLDGDEIEHFFDPQMAGRGLGLSQTTDMRFFQTEIGDGDLLLALSALPAGWSEKTLQGVRGQKLATLRRRFLSEAGSDIHGILLAVKAGRGRLDLLATSQEVEALEPQESGPQVTEKGRAVSGRTRQAQAGQESGMGERAATPEIQSSPLPKQGESLSDTQPLAAQPWASRALSGLDSLRARLAEFVDGLLPQVQNFLQRMLPEDTDFNLPPRTMAMIAALVPVGVVILVSLIYFQVGRGQLYENYMARAQAAAAAAEARQNPEEVRAAWEAALLNAQRAEAYEDTDEAATLRSQAQAALDEFDAIERLDFELALFNALPDDVRITRMEATNNEVYMLDSTSGEVLRAFLTGGGYQLDSAFRCGPGPYGGIIVSALVDLALLPRGNPREAALVAMDGNGNLIYCLVEDSPLAVPLEAPDSNWGNPVAISVENENLYVLDPLTNAVWLYSGDEYSFVEEPRFFFGADVPTLQEAIDLALQEEDLYVLTLDGQMALCQYSADLENPTTCQDPIEYTDSRPGREDGPLISDAHFLQMQATDPPEPSVYMLDPIVPSVYQFSLRLSLVRQYRAAEELPEGVVSAFAVSPNRAIFLAYDNQLYIGFLP